MAYGTQQEVAAMASMWTRAGVWVDPVGPVPGPADKGTNPTLTQVNDWLTNISAQMDLTLLNHRFVAPIPNTNTIPYDAISQYVVSLVADLCHFKNSSGRFFTEKLVERGVTPMAAILKDMDDFVKRMETGLIAAGVPQVDASVPGNNMVFRVIGNFPDTDNRSRSL